MYLAVALFLAVKYEEHVINSSWQELKSSSYGHQILIQGHKILFFFFNCNFFFNFYFITITVGASVKKKKSLLFD